MLRPGSFSSYAQARSLPRSSCSQKSVPARYRPAEKFLLHTLLQGTETSRYCQVRPRLRPLRVRIRACPKTYFVFRYDVLPLDTSSPCFHFIGFFNRIRHRFDISSVSSFQPLSQRNSCEKQRYAFHSLVFSYTGISNSLFL